MVGSVPSPLGNTKNRDPFCYMRVYVKDPTAAEACCFWQSSVEMSSTLGINLSGILGSTDLSSMTFLGGK